MVVLDRRSLVKGLALLPVAAGVACCDHPDPAPDVPVSSACPVIPPLMDFVNIVFHGTWIFLVYPDHIQALAPRIGGSGVPEHVSGMGGVKRIRKDALKSGCYKLTGFETNDKFFVPPDGSRTVVLDAKRTKIKIKPDSLYYSIHLPLPESMTPAGHMRISRKPGTKVSCPNNPPFCSSDKYLYGVFNNAKQLFSSVQIFTYRPTVSSGKPVSSRIQDDSTGGCYQNACYHGTPSPRPVFEDPAFEPDVTQNCPTPGSRILLNSCDYPGPDGKKYVQYHVAYVVYRSQESGAHEDHAFGCLASTLGIDVKSDFCNYNLDELPMSAPIGFSHGQLNLDAFPRESNGRLDRIPIGWYSDEYLRELLTADVEALRTKKLSPEARLVLATDFSEKPIGNCRSGNVVVLMPPS
jgi:hypothetical protein